MLSALGQLEAFLHTTADMPALVHCGLAHVQFETIHPFLDGNGRVGRLLMTFLLVHRGVLRQPLLYLSTYLKRHRAEYYDRLMAVRNDGNWESWLQFFFRGVIETANDAASTAGAIVRLREDHRSLLQAHGMGNNEVRLLDLLYQTPVVNLAHVGDRLEISEVTAGRVVDRFRTLGFLDETTGQRRNRIFQYSPYWHLLQDRAETSDGDPPGHSTGSGA